MKKSSLKINLIIFSGAALITALLISIALILIVFPGKYKKEILSASEKYDLPAELISAVIWTESKFDPNAESDKGAVGLMQLMPSTASWLYGSSIDENTLKNEEINIELGCKYLRYLLDKFGKSELMLAAYNAGEGNVTSWIENGEIENIPFGETRKYINKVNAVKSIYGIRSLFLKIGLSK